MKNLLKLCDELEAASRAATPGPWKTWKYDGVCQQIYSGEPPNQINLITGDEETNSVWVEWNNANYIALANPQNILQLTQALREAVYVAHFYVEWADDTEANEDAIKSKTFGDKARAFLARWKENE